MAPNYSTHYIQLTDTSQSGKKPSTHHCSTSVPSKRCQTFGGRAMREDVDVGTQSRAHSLSTPLCPEGKEPSAVLSGHDSSARTKSTVWHGVVLRSVQLLTENRASPNPHSRKRKDSADASPVCATLDINEITLALTVGCEDVCAAERITAGAEGPVGAFSGVTPATSREDDVPLSEAIQDQQGSTNPHQYGSWREPVICPSTFLADLRCVETLRIHAAGDTVEPETCLHASEHRQRRDLEGLLYCSDSSPPTNVNTPRSGTPESHGSQTGDFESQPGRCCISAALEQHLLTEDSADEPWASLRSRRGFEQHHSVQRQLRSMSGRTILRTCRAVRALGWRFGRVGGAVLSSCWTKIW